MSIIQRMKEGDNLYEVIFDDGRKKSGLCLKEAANLVDKLLDKNRKEFQKAKDNPEGNSAYYSLVHRSQMGNK